MRARRPRPEDRGNAHDLVRSLRGAGTVILSIVTLLLLFAIAVANVLGERRR